MNYSETIENFFDYIIDYIYKLVDILNAGELGALLGYLWICIPEPVRIVIIVTILLFILIGAIKMFHK